MPVLGKVERIPIVASRAVICRPEIEPFYERHGFSAEVGGERLMRRQVAC